MHADNIIVLDDGEESAQGTHEELLSSSPVYREKVTNLNRLIAERYGDNKNVILWHISNEFGGECHCNLCQEAFREYLKKNPEFCEKIKKEIEGDTQRGKITQQAANGLYKQINKLLEM